MEGQAGKKYDAGYAIAQESAQEHGLNLPMQAR
jgi:hypothetical protein